MQPRPIRTAFHTIAAVAGLTALAFTSACGAHIGDKCTLSTDCSTQGTRLCDTTEPSGYCTIYNCGGDDAGNSCPDNAVCVDFNPSVPGCAYSDRSPSAMAQRFCMKSCENDSDCRESDGYVCRSPKGAPWAAAIIANNQGQKVCITAPDDTAPGSVHDYDASVCWANWPDAGFTFTKDAGADAGADATATDAAGDGSDSGADSSLDAPLDATVDASFADAGVDATLSDAAGDATLDGAADSGGDSEAIDAGPDSASDAAIESGAGDAGGTDADTSG